MPMKKVEDKKITSNPGNANQWTGMKEVKVISINTKNFKSKKEIVKQIISYCKD